MTAHPLIKDFTHNEGSHCVNSLPSKAQTLGKVQHARWTMATWRSSSSCVRLVISDSHMARGSSSRSAQPAVTPRLGHRAVVREVVHCEVLLPLQTLLPTAAFVGPVRPGALCETGSFTGHAHTSADAKGGSCCAAPTKQLRAVGGSAPCIIEYLRHIAAVTDLVCKTVRLAVLLSTDVEAQYTVS